MNDQLNERILNFLDAFELVFHYDWDFTKLNILDEYSIDKDDTFLDPRPGEHFTGGKGDNWANRSRLISTYRELRAFSISEGILIPEDETNG